MPFVLRVEAVPFYPLMRTQLISNAWRKWRIYVLLQRTLRHWCFLASRRRYLQLKFYHLWRYRITEAKRQQELLNSVISSWKDNTCATKVKVKARDQLVRKFISRCTVSINKRRTQHRIIEIIRQRVLRGRAVVRKVVQIFKTLLKKRHSRLARAGCILRKVYHQVYCSRAGLTKRDKRNAKAAKGMLLRHMFDAWKLVLTHQRQNILCHGPGHIARRKIIQQWVAKYRKKVRERRRRLAIVYFARWRSYAVSRSKIRIYMHEQNLERLVMYFTLHLVVDCMNHVMSIIQDEELQTHCMEYLQNITNLLKPPLSEEHMGDYFLTTKALVKRLHNSRFSELARRAMSDQEDLHHLISFLKIVEYAQTATVRFGLRMNVICDSFITIHRYGLKISEMIQNDGRVGKRYVNEWLAKTGVPDLLVYDLYENLRHNVAKWLNSKWPDNSLDLVQYLNLL